MKQRNRDNHKKQMPFGGAILLRLQHGDIAKIARSMKPPVDRSMVSRVARAEKTSERVRRAIVRYLLRRGHAPRSAYMIEHGAR